MQDAQAAREKLVVPCAAGNARAAPAVADGALFLRNGTHLFRIEAKR